MSHVDHEVTLAGERESHKEKSAAFSLPPEPRRIWARIEAAANAGAPGFTVEEGLKIPALRFTAEWRNYDRPPASREIRPAVAALLDGEPAGAERVADSPQAAARIRWLTAAAYYDLGGNSEDDLADHYHAGKGDPEREAREDVRRGRDLWVAIGAWPWWSIKAAWADGYIGEEPPLWDFATGLPAEWWQLARVVATFEAWISGSQKPLRAHDAAHGLGLTA